MTEQAPAHLISQLERRTQRLVDDLDETRCQLAAAQAHHTLLEQKVQALEAQRYELQEACRGLSEQNEALESHSRHLQVRLEQSGTQQPLSRHTRQSRGLSALLGQNRAAPHTPDAKPELVAEPAADTATTPEPDAKPESIARSEPTVTSEPVTAEPVTAEPVTAEPVKPEPIKPEPVKQEPAETPAPSPQALLKEWYKRYDRAFFKGHTLPLKVGIHEDLAAAEPWPEKLVRRALACYVNLPRYLKAMRNDAGRIDLQGQPAGSVDQGAADHAQRKLERLQAERRSSQGAAKARAKTSASAEAKAKQGSDAEAGKGATKEKDTSQKAAKGKAKHRAKGGVAEKSRKNAPRGPGKHRQADAGRGDKRERDVLPDDPAKRMQLKLDALMARHTKHDTKQ